MQRLLASPIFLGLLAFTWFPAACMAQPSPRPTFTRALRLEPSADTSANVGIGDVNGDGALDLVLIKGRHWPGTSRVLLGDGHGHFDAGHDLGTERHKSYSGSLVDLDGDGALDVILSNDTPNPKVILRNDGTGTFRPSGTFGEAAWKTRNAAVADLNGDGRPDIVVANRARDAKQYYCLNQGNGQFDAPCVAFADYPATTITPADVNGDGRTDLVVPHRDGGQSYVYLNAGSAGFPAQRRIAFGPPDASMRMSAVADLDEDGAPDIVVIDDDRNAVEIYYGTRSGGFEAATSLETGDAIPYALSIADLDRDGRPDVLVGYVEARPAIFYRDGVPRRFTRVAFGDDQGSVYGFAVADLDGDGQPDIAAARSEAPNMVYFGEPRTSAASAHAAGRAHPRIP